MHKPGGLLFNRDFAQGAGWPESLMCCRGYATLLIPKQKQVKLQVYEILSLFYHKMILKCAKKYSELCGMLLRSLLTEKHMVFLVTGEVLNTISELILVLETSIM